MTDAVDTAQASAAPRKELTVRVVILGLLLAVVMGAANVYVGLRAGMTVSASIPAAVMAMLLFKMLFKDSTILEANQVQTCASAGESLAAGIIFTMPAMILIGFWDSFDFWSVTIIALTGGLLGILFMIPMRKVFILNNDELAYPEGVACAAVLKAGEEQGNTGAGRNLLLGGLLGGAVAISAKLFGAITGTLEAAAAVGSRIFYFGGDLSPMLIAIGFIVRLNVAVLIFIGGAISWLIGIPLLGGAEQFPVALDGAYELWSTKIRCQAWAGRSSQGTRQKPERQQITGARYRKRHIDHGYYRSGCCLHRGTGLRQLSIHRRDWHYPAFYGSHGGHGLLLHRRGELHRWTGG